MSTRKTGRPKRRLEGLRENVLDEAWALLVERGLGDLTLAELGRRVDTSAGHLLYHFGSKDDLLLELLRRNEAELWTRWQEVRAEGAEFADLYRAFCRQFLPSDQGDPRWLVWLELWPRGLRVDSVSSALEEFDDLWRDELADFLAQAGAADAVALARRICWLMDGLAVAIVVGEGGITANEAIEHAVALLPEGLR
ncbi:MAG: TetR/AcrR family transcriptional regulator [Aeromicrobium sp.]